MAKESDGFIFMSLYTVALRVAEQWATPAEAIFLS